jgi:hypothetical protein
MGHGLSFADQRLVAQLSVWAGGTLMRSWLFRAVLLSLMCLVIPGPVDACPIGVFDTSLQPRCAGTLDEDSDWDIGGGGSVLAALGGNEMFQPGSAGGSGGGGGGVSPRATGAGSGGRREGRRANGSALDALLGSNSNAGDTANAPLLELADAGLTNGPPGLSDSHPGQGNAWGRGNNPARTDGSTEPTQTTRVPEPSTMALLGAGLAALLLRRRTLE